MTESDFAKTLSDVVDDVALWTVKRQQ
jgi:hypothetical protein